MRADAAPPFAAPSNLEWEVELSPRIHSVDDVRSLVGEPLGYSPYVSVSPAMISTFADVTGDHQWIHVDDARAKAGPFGRTIAHGYLLLSLIPALLNHVLVVDEPGTRVNYGLNRVRFVTPVGAGDDVRLAATVARVEPVGDGWQIILDVTLELRDAPKPACVVQAVYRWYPS